MTFHKISCLFILSVMLSSCSVGIKTVATKAYSPRNATDEVKIYDVSEEAPSNAEMLGAVRIYDAGSVNCGYPVVIEAAKTEARKIGGDALKITEHIRPNIMSSCHQIRANILKLGGITSPDTTLKPQAGQHQDYINETRVPIATPSYKGFYLSAEGGLSWRINKINPDANSFEKEYLKDLKSGYHFGGSATYYFTRYVGIGVMFDQYRSSNSVEATAQNAVTGQVLSGVLHDDITINFIGATFDYRLLSRSERNAFHLKISLGYAGYRDEFGFVESGVIEASTFGLCYDISYDINIADHWYVSPAVGYRVATLTSFDVTMNNQTSHQTLDKDQYEGLTRVDLSAGLRYKF